MINKTVLAFAFLDANYRQRGAEFRLWQEMLESDREQHLITAQLIIDNSEITAKQTHEAWVARRKTDGWQQADRCDLDDKLHTQLLAFEELPAEEQRAEEAGVKAMCEALPYARDNRLPPDLEFEVMKRIAVSNANFYLDTGDMLGLDPFDQPSSMLFWGSLANARHHAELLKRKAAFSKKHSDLLAEGISNLKETVFEQHPLQLAVPGGRRDQGPFDCSEDPLEHGLVSLGSLHLNSAFEKALSEASQAGYCERCLVASQIGLTVSVLVAGSRSEGMSDAEIMAVISDLIAHGFDQAGAGAPLRHDGLKLKVMQ